MPTIEFRTYNPEAFQRFKPVVAKTYMPEWWKSAKIRIDHRGEGAQTIRSCPAMDDYLKTGWYIITACDIPVMNGYDWDWPEESEKMSTKPYNLDGSDNLQMSPTHPSAQFQDSFEYMGEEGPVKDAFKMGNFWNITTPPGYSVFFIDPFLFQNKYFAVWQGIIDTDTFNLGMDNAQIIFYPKVRHSFVIPKGTPILQIVPFKRDEWKSTFMYGESKDWFNSHGISEQSMQKWQRKQGLTDSSGNNVSVEDRLNIGGYRKGGYHTNKANLYKEGENPPPECPMHKKEEVQLEMDFKEKQRSLTDLNWDGHEERD